MHVYMYVYMRDIHSFTPCSSLPSFCLRFECGSRALSLSLYIYIYKYIYIYIYTHTHTRTHTYKHTYIHTHICENVMFTVPAARHYVFISPSIRMCFKSALLIHTVTTVLCMHSDMLVCCTYTHTLPHYACIQIRQYATHTYTYTRYIPHQLE
jgi:hypothetical protein